MQNKITAWELLQKLEPKLIAKSIDQGTKAKIEKILINTLKKINSNSAVYSLLETRLELDSKTSLTLALDRLSATVSAQFTKERSATSDLRKDSLEKLASIYLAAHKADWLTDHQTSIEAYEELKNSPIQSDYDSDYLFYYWNHELNEIEIALMRFRLSKVENIFAEWQSGILIYFEELKDPHLKGYNWIQSSQFRPLRVSTPEPNVCTTTVLSGRRGNHHFSKEFDNGFASSFRILTSETPANDRKILMGSYSVAISDGKNPTSGIGVFVRIGDESNSGYPLQNKSGENGCAIGIIDDVYYLEHAIPDVITNLLFDRRDSLRTIIKPPYNYSENKLFDSFEVLPNRPHVKAIEEIAGLYFGYHLQNDLGRTKKGIKGALRTVVLEIKPSGICYLLDDEDRHRAEKEPYFGFLSMRDYEQKKMLINLDREINEYMEYHSWRLQFFLEQNADNILEGVMSGFSKKLVSPITSPVRFKKVEHFNSIKEFLLQKKEDNSLNKIFPSTFFKADYPQRYIHEDLENLLSWDDQVISYFSSINDNQYFNSPHQSLPHNFINLVFDQYNTFKYLEGNYYLVSRSHGADFAISKVKVQLRKYGETVFVYPEKGKLDCFVGRWEMHENGNLLKIRLKFRKRDASHVKDVLRTNARSFGDFIFHLDKTEHINKIDYLQSISVWVDYENKNMLVAKREFLFAASENGDPSLFPEHFITDYTYKHPADKLNENEFFSGIRYFETEDEKTNSERKRLFLLFMKNPDKNLVTVNNQRHF